MPSKLGPQTGPSSRAVPVKVLHLSMPRTGSVSMMAAYKILGFTIYNGFMFGDRAGDQPLWERAIDAKFYGKGKPFAREDFDAFLGEFEVLSDVPVIGFTEEFVEMYPEAKIVLVDRDIDQWYHSYTTCVIAAYYTWRSLFMRYFLELFITARPGAVLNKLDFAMFNATTRAGRERNARDTYRRHYANVRRLVPKERLLEYKMGSGWEPLCEFLGTEVPGPEVKFPYLNEGENFDEMLRKVQNAMIRRQLKSIAVSPFFMVPLALGVAAWVWAKWWI
ncbi:hypothetical protein GX51_05697 [Blastomyces parvus]|uniref:Uncharacterized protein n=1 Tax=Blastomyces parvus TaxID=2060905 RepID=A0A2B7WVX5_9EURO|nr:hypothetical protein GX51_05697 [Blastomyces parvus]